MKFFIAISILILAISENKAQSFAGITSGLNLSKAVYLEPENEQIIKDYRKLKPGFNFGIFLIQKLNPIISVEIKVLYSQKGLKMVQKPFHKTLNTMNFLEFPFSSQFKLFPNKNNSIYLEFGGFVSYWTDGKYKEYDMNNAVLQNVKVDFYNKTYEYSRIDYGVLFGLNYQQSGYLLSFNYHHGLAGSSKNSADALSNRTLCFNIGYLIVKSDKKGKKYN